MAKPDRLEIGARDTLSDLLSVWDADLGFGHIYIQTSNPDNLDSGPAVLMDREDVVKLFGWLGRWLHT